MLNKFCSVYAGHVDMPDLGQDATPVNERRFNNEHIVTVFEKTEAIAKAMDDAGWHSLWLAEHHFQHEGYEVVPNILMLAVHLAHLTKRIKIGSAFNITPMWHPLRLAEDFAVADILTKDARSSALDAAITPVRWRLRRAATGSSCQPRAVRRADRDHLQGLQRRVVLPPWRALHFASQGPVPWLRSRRNHAGPAAHQSPGGMLAADREC